MHAEAKHHGNPEQAEAQDDFVVSSPPLRMLYFIFHNLLQAMVRSRGLFLPIKGEIIKNRHLFVRDYRYFILYFIHLLTAIHPHRRKTQGCGGKDFVD